jgi:endonuclease/exonuclease/phosphatase (EEP) superfamily protein YafD
MKDRLRRALQGSPFVGGGIVAFSILVRLTLRDTLPGLSVVFYALPPVVGAGILAATGGAWLLQRRRRWAAGAFGVAVLLVTWQAGISVFRQAQSRGDLRVLLWNTQNGSRGWERLSPGIASHDADLVWLVEAQGAPESFPGFDWRRVPGGMCVGFRGTIRETEVVRFHPAGIAVVARGTVRDRPMVVVGVDVGANPLRPRGRAFEPLDALLARVKPDLVLGDFNTPRDSVFFEAWRSAGYRHAFEAAGNGTDLTWPMPLPVLSLDHVWSGPRLAPRSCRHVGSWASDHRAVVAEFTGSE